MAKIIVVMPDMDLGGITTSVINFCNELVEKGNVVSFLNMNNGQGYSGGISEKVRILRLSGMSVMWNLDVSKMRKASFLQKIWLIPIAVVKKIQNRHHKWLDSVFYRYQVSGEYDIAVAFRQCSPCYYFTLNCIQAKSKVAFIHGNLQTMGDVSSFEHFFKEFDVVNCVSKACCDGFRKQYPEIAQKFSFVYNMFPTEEIRKRALEEPIISLAKDNFLIVTVSRIENETKGTDRIIEICKLLKEDGHRFIWYVLGNGPDFKENVREVKTAGLEDRLVYCGSVRNPHAIVKKCDLSVLPTRGEAYSMTVIESQIVGTPIVVAKYDGVEEAVQMYKSGLIAEQTIESMTDMIAMCIQNKDGILDIMRSNLKKKCFDNENAYWQFMQTIDAVE